MSYLFQGAQDTNASGVFNCVGRDQYNISLAPKEQSVLAALRPVDRTGTGYYVQPCMTGTRGWIINLILYWLDNDAMPNILWLSGSPGAGKSAIASTLVSLLEGRGRLGSSFFCKRGDASLGDPSAFWRTVAFDLAQSDSFIAERLVENLEARRVEPGRPDIQSHFKYLIEDPLTESRKRRMEALNILDNDIDVNDKESKTVREKLTTRPPVIVLDALDECGSDSFQSAQRQTLMNTITKWADLHPSFRLIITSRDERISRAFRSVCYHIVLESGDLVRPEATRDIYTFFEQRFADIVDQYDSLPSSWPGATIIGQLTQRAAGLFIWAETVMRFLGQGFVKEQLHLILAGAFYGEGNTIDQLYRQVLQLSFQNCTDGVLDTYKRVVGAIVLAKIPLHRCDLRYFLGKEEDETAVELILQKLSSVIRSRHTDGRIYISHLSFTEFICDSERCGEAFAIRTRIHSRVMALACFQAMKRELRFDICQLETSHVRNIDIPDLEARIEHAISTYLSYSCRFWGGHLQATDIDVEMFQEVEDFLHTRFLYWLEVLSLIAQVKVAFQVLLSVREWSRARHKGIYAFAVDAGRFMTVFGSVISQSAPHIYISALPFTPSESVISKIFLPLFPHTLCFETGKATHWPAVRNILECPGDVLVVAFSEDDKRITSGCDDNTVLMWDMETGNVISESRNDRTDKVTSIAISLDSKRVMSCSHDNTIYVWHTETEDVISGPLEGHTSRIHSAAFSQDSKRIASSSADAIFVWDVETGDVIAGPLGGHTYGINSVVFSQDGNRIVSGSRDNKVRVWDVETGDVILGPLDGHTYWVVSVSSSLDGRCISSGSLGGTICVWDAESRDIILGPLDVHVNEVRSVAFSSDNTYIASGSSDNTIRVFNVETGAAILGAFKGHTSWVNSVAFSQDGKHIASGSNDKTIRVWDVDIKDEILGSLNGHTEGILSVTFSLDDKHIFSYSDNEVCIWDAETGVIALGPLNSHAQVTSAMFLQDDKCTVLSAYDNSTVLVWDAETGDAVSGPLQLKGTTDNVRTRLWHLSQDGKRVVSGSYDRTLCLCDVKTGDVLWGPLEGHTGIIYAVTFSQDGKHIASGSTDHTIIVWDAETGSIVVGPLEGHTDWVRSVAFSQDGKDIVSGSDDCTIIVWDAETGNIIFGPLEGHTNRVSSVAFSHDGKHIVTGSADTTICVWDVETRRVILGPLYGHTDIVSSTTFSRNGKHLVSGSYDNGIRVWNVSVGALKRHNHVSPMINHDIPCNNLWEPSIHGLGDNLRWKNGWIVDERFSALLFWVPPWNRVGLWFPRNTAVIVEGSTKLDCSRFVHGKYWQQCRRAL